MSEQIGGQHAEGESAPHQDATGHEPPRPPRPPRNRDSNGSDKNPDPPNWVEKGTLIVLVVTFLAAAAAAVEGDRLARDTEDALADARLSGQITHNDAVNSENLTADALGQAARNAIITHNDTLDVIGKSDAANLISRHAADAGERAWVYPTQTTMEGDLAVGQPIKVLVQYINSGREPASAFVAVERFVPFSKEEWNGGKAAQSLEDWRKNICFKMAYDPKAPKDAATRAVYPQVGQTTYNMEIGSDDPSFPKKFTVADDLKNGGQVVAFQGCFIYRTIGSTHHTAFCNYYQNAVTKPPALNICTVGNNSD
jgi:hypothetical protein